MGTDDRVHGPGGQNAPVRAFSLDSNLNDFTNDELEAIAQIWSDVAEKYSPFNINVTTVVPPNFNDFQAIQMIVGGSHFDWHSLEPGAIGAAPFEGFTNNLVGNQGFAFSEDIIDNGSVTLNVANRELLSETIAHEAGHLFGLEHQSIFGVDGSLIEEYSNGNALGVPIMGNSGLVPNLSKHGIWFNGASSNRDEDDNVVFAGTQDDLDHLYNLLGYRADDFGPASSWTTNDNQGHFTAKGIIGNLLDTDGFRFTATGATAYFAMNNQLVVPMLTPRMELRTWPTNTPVTALWTTQEDDFFTMFFDNLVIGQQYVAVASSNFAYGSLGNYDIYGSNTNEFAYVQDGVLYINGYDNANDDIQLDLYFDDVNYYVDNVVNGNVIAVLIPKSSVVSIVINTKSGNDSVRYRSPLGVVSTTLDMGIGTDSLEVWGTPTANFFDMSATRVNFDITVVNFNSSVESLAAFGLGGNDSFAIDFPGSTTITMHGGDNNDTLTVASGAIGSIGGAIKYYGDAHSDTLVVNDAANANGRIFTIAPGRVQVSNGGQLREFEFESTTETVRVSAGSGADRFNVQGVLDGQTVRLDGNNGYDTFVMSNSLSGAVTANGNDGDDNFIVGDGNVGFLPAWILDGGNGNDAITFDNHLASINHTVEIQPNQIVFYSGVFTVSTVGFETVGWLGGSGNDQIRISGNMSQSINIDAGSGGDTIVVGYSSRAQFGANVSINGGAGNDSYQWTRGSNNWYQGIVDINLYDVLLDGGPGYNTLAVDETTRSAAGYYLYADRFYATDGAVFPVGFDIDYDNMLAMSFGAGGGTTNVGIYGTSSDIDAGNQISMSLGGGNDNVYLYPHDAQGNLTINGNVGIGGGAGTDSLYVDDSASSAPAEYGFANPFGAGTQNITGVGSGGFGVANDFEAITMTGSDGDDVYNINSYKSVIGLTINGGGGDDALEITPISKNLYDNMAAGSGVHNILAFNGGAGFDTFGVHNDNNNKGYSYAINGAAFTIHNSFTSPIFAAFMSQTEVEYTTVTAGPQSDTILVQNTAADTFHDLDAGPGVAKDTFAIGYPLSPALTSVIRGGVRISGGGGDIDEATVYNFSDTVGRTLHIENDFVGRVPGDDLFGPGGYLEYVGIGGSLTVRLGSGADVVYAAPNSVTPIIVQGNNPTSAPGDTLNLALASAVNYVVTPTSATAGNVTSDNLQTLSYTGFENGPNIVPEPELLGDYNGNGKVDTADYVSWRRTLGALVAIYSGADGNGNGMVDDSDYGVWREHFGETIVGVGAGRGATNVEQQAQKVVQFGGGAEAVETEFASYESKPSDRVQGAFVESRPIDVARDDVAESTTRRQRKNRQDVADDRMARDEAMMAWLSESPAVERAASGRTFSEMNYDDAQNDSDLDVASAELAGVGDESARWELFTRFGA